MPRYEQDVRPQEGKLKLVELMNTVQGEGQFIGVPSVFVRLGMCNLECSGCDTKWDSWSEENIEDIAGRVESFKSEHVVITGGEPTLWQDGLANLISLLGDRIITIESNGAVPIKNEYLLGRVNLWSFSPKVGSLGHDEKFSQDVVLDNIEKTVGWNQLKYVLDPNVPEHTDSVFTFHDRVDRIGFDRAEYEDEWPVLPHHFIELSSEDFERLGVRKRELIQFAGDRGVSVAVPVFVPDDRVFFQPLDRDTRVNISNAAKGVEPTQYAKDLVALTQLVFERSGCRFRVLPQFHKLLIWR